MVGTMARSMSLFLIRHGETVDNVAQLYAGSRDSALTNHGYQQATRLGLHFKARGLTFTHLFSSHLQRAAQTAGKIREAQIGPASDQAAVQDVPELVQLPALMEQDFGSLEGKKWTETNAADFVDVESKGAMAQRADAFLEKHLLPLFKDDSKPADKFVAVVSHGIFLSTLWKRLLNCLPPKSVTLCLDAQGTPRPSLEHLGGWTNTGFLELHMTKVSTDSPSAAVDQGAVRDEAISRIANGWTTTILTINGKDHLKGLKRTGGGVGSSRHDASQKSIETFFKRRRVE